MRARRFLLRVSLALMLAAMMVSFWLPHTQAEGPIKVEYYLDPEKPEATKESHLRLRVFDAQGKALSNAQITFTADMPQEAMTGSMPDTMKALKLQAEPEVRPGQYIVHPKFSMPGTWSAKLLIDSPSGQATEDFAVEVIEPKPFTGVNWPIIGSAVLVLALIVGVPLLRQARGWNRHSDEEEEEE